MKILDRYIFKKLISTFLFVTILSTSVLLLFDYIDNADTFVRKQIPIELVLTEYYFNLVPYGINMVSPIMIFLTVVFVITKLATNSEIIAMFGGGISLFRLSVPVTVFSLLFAIVVFILLGWIIPQANIRRIAFENKYLKAKIPYSERDIHKKVAPSTYIYVQSYDDVHNIGYKFTLEDFSGIILNSKLSADSIIWIAALDSWRLANYKIHQFKGEGEEIIYGTNKILKINLTPEDFRYKFWLHKELSLEEIDDQIRLMNKKGVDDIRQMQVEKYHRYSYPFSMFLLSFLAFLFSYKKNSGGARQKLVIGLLLASTYIAVSLFGQSIGEYGNINPLFAVCIPNILFTSIGLFCYKIGL